MRAITTLIAGISMIGLQATAQTTIANAGFENWEGTGASAEPVSWNSNKTGSSTAALGPQTCFQDNTVFHGGASSVRVETVAGPFSTVINGNVTTGVVNAPTLSKADGYIGTVNYTTSSDVRYMNFTGTPDSLVGWYQYTPGAASETGRIRAILHTNDYYDPETPTTYHPACTADKIGMAEFVTPSTSVATWTRFSVPFNYATTATPTHIMINITSSADQNTTVTGSKLWIDDLEPIYVTATSVENIDATSNAKVYSHDKQVTVITEQTNGTPSTLLLMDMTGRRVFKGETGAGKLSTFDLNWLQTGIYLYQLSNNGNTQTGKISL